MYDGHSSGVGRDDVVVVLVVMKTRPQSSICGCADCDDLLILVSVLFRTPTTEVIYVREPVPNIKHHHLARFVDGITES